MEARLGERGLAVAFVAPAVLVLGAVVGGGMLYALFLSLNEVNFVGGQPEYQFVGLSNYTRFLVDARLQQASWQTALFTVLRVTATIGLSLAAALSLNQALPGLPFLRSFLLVPWALASIVNALMWGWIFNGNFGAANAVLQGFGILNSYRSWLGDSGTALPAILFAEVWKAVPFSSLMFLAALQGVPRDLHEAARVDGAGPVDRFRHVILPSIRPVLLVVLVIETMWALKTFDLVWVLTKGGPQDASLLLNVYAYQQTFQFFKFGYGSAVAYFVAMLILGLTAVYYTLLRGDGESA